MIRPSRQRCSLLTGDDSVAPAPTACRTTRSGSSTTSSVRLVARSTGNLLASCRPRKSVAPTNHRNELLPVHRGIWPVIHAASQSLDEDERLRSDAELERFLRSVAPGS